MNQHDTSLHNRYQMKFFLFIAAMLPGFFQLVMAQETAAPAAVPAEKIIIEVKETKDKMSLGVNNCLQVFIPGAVKGEVERDLLKYMKNYNVKGDSKKGEYLFDNAEIKAFGNNLVDVYVHLDQKAGGVDLKVFFDLGGAFLSAAAQPDKYKTAEEIVHRFARDEAVAAIGVQITATQKILDGKMKEYDKLVRQDSSYSKKIKDCRAVINKAETDQQAVRVTVDTKKQDLLIQQQQMEELKSKQEGIE